MFDLALCYHLFKTNPNTAYFWSGLGSKGKYIAESIARQNNGTTLEMLMETHKDKLIEAGFEYDESLDRFVFGEENAGDWRLISKAYADHASGDVRTVLGEQVREGSVWNQRELPALKENSDVNSIILVDPQTGSDKGILLSKSGSTESNEKTNASPVLPEQNAIVLFDTNKLETEPNEAKVINQVRELGTKLIDVGKIAVSPFEFDSILEIRIKKELNEHSTLYVCGIIRDEKQFLPVTGITEGANIKCENDAQVYFNGILQNLKITRENDVYRLEAYALANTILLDTVKHKRSFQDNDQTYQSIVETIIADNNGTVSHNAPEMTVENIILQYDETDWEFAKRLASHTQNVLIPITADNPAFHFGTPDIGDAELLSDNYAISKDFKAFRRMLAETEPLTVDDITMYTVETDYLACDLGEKLNLNGTELHVYRISLSFENSALTIEYTLCGEKAISTPKSYNRAITGLVLDGKVLKVENDNVKLHLDIDEQQDEETAHLFVYATGYSTEGHTGWYVMPEKDDTVQLLFPGEDDKDAYAVSSVRRDDTERIADPLVKFWRTSFGKEIKMDAKEILITAKDEITDIQINMDTGIKIETPKPIIISSDATMGIMSKKNMTFATNENLIIVAKDSITVDCSKDDENEDSENEGSENEDSDNKITITPSAGIKVRTKQKINITSIGDINIHSDSKLDISAGVDMTISTNKELQSSSVAELELSGNDSSIKADNVFQMVADWLKFNPPDDFGDMGVKKLLLGSTAVFSGIALLSVVGVAAGTNTGKKKYRKAAARALGTMAFAVLSSSAKVTLMIAIAALRGKMTTGAKGILAGPFFLQDLIIKLLQKKFIGKPDPIKRIYDAGLYRYGSISIHPLKPGTLSSIQPSKTLSPGIPVRSIFESRSDVESVVWERTEDGKSIITVTFNNGKPPQILTEGEDYYIGKDGNAYLYNNVRTIAEAGGAEVDFKKNPEDGSTITVTMPSGEVVTLIEGEDYIIGEDGKAHFLDETHGPLPPGAESSIVRWPIDMSYLATGTGCRKGVFSEYRSSSRPDHNGIDLSPYSTYITGTGKSSVGPPIVAIVSGEVISVVKNQTTSTTGYGNYVAIMGIDGREYKYAHMSNVNVEIGQKVSSGTSIGDSGTTGHSTGVHLHLEVKENGRNIDPYQILMHAGGSIL
jgi:murein DD-endopeptidase MepM/ murein hydrolase activator NlpD